MNMPDPLVSVLIPAYNAERYLGEALDSVVAQTWPNVEVIVVDDGSTDATLEVARRYEREGVKVVAQKNAGAAAARNRAFNKAQGTFIQYFDADDILEPTKIENQVRRLLGEPAGTLATSAWARFFEDDMASAVVKPGDDYRDYEQPIEWLLDDWTGRGTMPPGAWLYPREIIEKAGPWHEGLSLNDDMEFFTRTVLASTKIAFCPSGLLYYRSVSGSLSKRRSDQALWSQYEVVRLSTERVLAVEDSERTRYASACYWQSFIFMAYPQVPDLVKEAESRIERLGGGGRRASVSRPFVPVRDYIGWKPALRLQRMYSSSGAEAFVQKLKKRMPV